MTNISFLFGFLVYPIERNISTYNYYISREQGIQDYQRVSLCITCVIVHRLKQKIFEIIQNNVNKVYKIRSQFEN